MTRLVIQKMLQFVLLLLVASILVWSMLYLLPGDPARVMLGPFAPPEQVEAMRRELGLDQPVTAQYVRWISGAAVGDLGASVRFNVPVTQIIGARLAPTIQLTFVALVVSAALAIPLGTYVGFRPKSRISTIVMAYCSLSLAVPSFWAGMLFVLLFSGTGLGWLPAASSYASLITSPGTALRNLAGPVIVLALLLSGILIRFIASAVAGTVQSEFIRTARAKGVRGKRLVTRHVMRNAALPVVTVLGLQLASVLGGVVVIEAVFNYPGLGLLSVQAVGSRDYPLIQAIILLTIAIFLVINFVVDLLYAVIDPRVRE